VPPGPTPPARWPAGRWWRPGARPAARLSWPDRLRHALALAAGGAGPLDLLTRVPGEADERDGVDLAAYERLLDTVRVEPPARA